MGPFFRMKILLISMLFLQQACTRSSTTGATSSQGSVASEEQEQSSNDVAFDTSHVKEIYYIVPDDTGLKLDEKATLSDNNAGVALGATALIAIGIFGAIAFKGKNVAKAGTKVAADLKAPGGQLGKAAEELDTLAAKTAGKADTAGLTMIANATNKSVQDLMKDGAKIAEVETKKLGGKTFQEYRFFEEGTNTLKTTIHMHAVIPGSSSGIKAASEALHASGVKLEEVMVVVQSKALVESQEIGGKIIGAGGHGASLPTAVGKTVDIIGNDGFTYTIKLEKAGADAEHQYSIMAKKTPA